MEIYFLPIRVQYNETCRIWHTTDAVRDRLQKLPENGDVLGNYRYYTNENLR